MCNGFTGIYQVRDVDSFQLPEIRQHIIPSPPGRAFSCPAIEVFLIPPHMHQSVDGACATYYSASRHLILDTTVGLRH